MLRLIPFLTLLLLGTSFLANADNSKSACVYTQATLNAYKTPYTDLLNAAQDFGAKLCTFYHDTNAKKLSHDDKVKMGTALLNSRDVFIDIASKTYLQELPVSMFDGLDLLVEQWKTQTTNFAQNPDYLTQIRIRDKTVLDSEGKRKKQFQLHLPPNTKLVFKSELVDMTALESCGSERNEKCMKVIDDVDKSVRLAYVLMRDKELELVRRYYSELNAEFKRFYRDARYQTPLDAFIAANLFQRDHFRSLDLVGPPKMQVFTLRPSLVFEHLHDASKGDRDDVSIALEIIGVNWWELGIGASFTTIYHDRKDTDTFGFGGSIHIKNKFTVGYVFRDDDKGSVFVNLDLLEWVGENKDTYSKYLDYVN
ncbi:hypothetical protein [Vibrio sp. WXL103]|uniref:hypothetical protein n=1 Tax=Vibrio sp. WXL103 TaxID=3450710 RepID=UPI003EC638E6